MSDRVLITIVAALQVVATAIVGGIVSVLVARMGSANHAAVKEVDGKIVGLSIAVNGRLEQLLDSANAQGRQDQRDETRSDEIRRGEEPKQ